MYVFVTQERNNKNKRGAIIQYSEKYEALKETLIKFIYANRTLEEGRPSIPRIFVR